MSRISVLGLDPATYQRHSLHAEDRVWVEKNCYIDIWIEVLHALRLDPVAAMGFTVAIDFEGDQVTFFKPPHDELRELYGVDVQELNVWRPLVEHAVTHLGDGKLISTEADAFYLPDTSGTDYKTTHTKTTIVIESIDVEARRMGYFHNASYYSVEGDDFAKLFRLEAAPDPTFMPLFAELVRIDRVVRRSNAELATLARANLKKHLARSPVTNPVRRFGARFQAELPSLQEKGLAHYHAWAFATVRQLGAASELTQLHLRWLGAAGQDDLAGAAADFERISQSAKAFILKAARAVNGKKAFDALPIFGEMADAWDRAIETLAARA